MSARTLQWVVLAAALVLLLGLWLAPSQVNRVDKGPKIQDKGSIAGAFDAESLLTSARRSLDPGADSLYSLLLVQWKNSGEKDVSISDSIGRLWDSSGIPAASAVWFERKALLEESEKSWQDAAYRYFDAFKIAGDTALRTELVSKAIASYEKVLEINPSNLNAKTDLGACYAEGTSEPMRGITLLREVVATNPEHEMAQYNLGMLSVKSGQYEKALERFDKVIAINPARSEVYFFKGQVLLEMGDTLAAIRELESFVKKSPDYEAATQVGTLLQNLKATRSL